MEQKRLNNRKVSALIAAVLVVAMIATAVTVSVLTQPQEAQKPALYFEGVTLRPVLDAATGETSIQALVDVYAEDVTYLNNVQFYAKYNSSYWVPSDMETNAEVTGVTRQFFSVPEELYGGRNPYYVFGQGATTVSQAVNAVEAARQTVYLLLSTRNIPETEIADWPEAGSVKRFLVSEDSGLGEGEEEDGEGQPEGGSGPSWNLYIDAAGKKVRVVTLSFRVNPDKLAEMVNIFQGKQSPLGLIDGHHLLQLQTQYGTAPGGGRTMVAVYDWPNTEAVTNPRIYSLIGKNLATTVSWTFPERPVRLVSNERTVTVNAYQAYTDATVADLARTLQKYSPTARATYSSGREEDFLLYWGGGEGCYITNDKGEQRLFRWTQDAAGEYDGGYELLKWDDTAEDWVPETGSWYDPTGGRYVVQQYVDYPWEGGLRRYEHPVQVELTVTPVEMAGLTANDLYKSYANPDVPDDYDKLELPDEALITTNVVTGSGSLTMAIDSWMPGYTTDMSTITGVRTEAGGTTTAVTWTDATDDNNVGVYTFDANPEFTAAAIRQAYPWLTVAQDYTLQAIREITGAEDRVDDDLYEVIGSRNDETGALTLEVRKKLPDGSGYDVMADNTTFRVMLPNGELVNPGWFGTGGGSFSYPAAPQDYNVGGVNVSTYPITVTPGSATGNYVAEREMVRRSINLGGYFKVEVTEPGKKPSNFLPTYLGPRKNIYLASYTIVDGSAETATLKNAFDFTGDRSALLPLYRNQRLGTTVVLPYGSTYSVATRYDGMTGAEPGRVHTVVVDNWTNEAARGGAWSGTQWTGTSPITVQYGADLFARRAFLTGFGTVENEGTLPNYKDRQVTILAQVLEEDFPEESLRLTYEETGASVLLKANGEVDEVRFDPRQVGYHYNQMVTLTLTNTGDTDIRGLYLDTTALDGVFRVINPPATELPAGASTTFTLSYQLDLAKGVYSTKTAAAPLKVFSATGERKQFHAYLKVTDDPLWRVTVRSEDDAMGGGRLVIGAADGALDDTAAPNIYETGEKVWVLAEPKGEYTVSGAYYYNKSGVKVPLPEHTPVVTSDGKMLFSFDMPEQNVVVYVSFKETAWAKLRLELLRVDAGPDDNSLQWKLPLYHADDYTIAQATESETPDLSKPDYLVIIPAEDERVQLKVKLREILKDVPVLSADVKIVLNYEGDATDVTVYDYRHTPGEAQPLLDHASANFDAPQPGRTVTASITITAEEEGETVTRNYTVKIARRPTEDEPPEYSLYPGNSPYGMIDGDPAIVDKDAAKAAFNVADRFDDAYRPATAGGATNTYWTEAWTGANYDRDSTALFIYQGEPFDDYGPVEVQNTARDHVELTQVSRSVTVTLLDTSKPNPTQAEQFAGTDTVTLKLGTADVVRVADWWKGENGTDYNDRIRPGVYSLTYTFTDVDGAELTFQRPLIILSRNGDVNLDGLEDSSDAAAIEGRLGSPLGHEAAGYPDGQVFLYRVCDANNDRNLNNVDANAIRGGKCVDYYLPTDYNDMTTGTNP